MKIITVFHCFPYRLRCLYPFFLGKNSGLFCQVNSTECLQSQCEDRRVGGVYEPGYPSQISPEYLEQGRPVYLVLHGEDGLPHSTGGRSLQAIGWRRPDPRIERRSPAVHLQLTGFDCYL